VPNCSGKGEAARGRPVGITPKDLEAPLFAAPRVSGSPCSDVVVARSQALCPLPETGWGDQFGSLEQQVEVDQLHRLRLPE